MHVVTMAGVQDKFIPGNSWAYGIYCHEPRDDKIWEEYGRSWGQLFMCLSYTKDSHGGRLEGRWTAP